MSSSGCPSLGPKPFHAPARLLQRWHRPAGHQCCPQAPRTWGVQTLTTLSPPDVASMGMQGWQARLRTEAWSSAASSRLSSLPVRRFQMKRRPSSEPDARKSFWVPSNATCTPRPDLVAQASHVSKGPQCGPECLTACLLTTQASQPAQGGTQQLHLRDGDGDGAELGPHPQWLQLHSHWTRQADCGGSVARLHRWLTWPQDYHQKSGQPTTMGLVQCIKVGRSFS